MKETMDSSKTFSLTLFESIYDNKSDKQYTFESWDKFKALLYHLSEQPGYKAAKGEKPKQKPSPLISPATYDRGKTRKNENVIDWGRWAALDIDDHVFEGDLQNELYTRYGCYQYCCYSTASSTDSHPKFRLVFPLTERVRSDQIRHFWFALNAEVGGISDAQTKDLSRMYYIPGQYPNANNFIFDNSDGDFINPYDLMKKHPYVEKSAVGFLDRLPPAIRDAVLKERANKLTNTDISWTSYRDCPFVSKKLVSEYIQINSAGWYHKMYQLMVSIAMNATKQGYPITEKEIAILCRQLDTETGNWYKSRPLEKEAKRALDFAYSNQII